MGIISWIFFGLFVGIISKLLVPGKDGGGFIVTTLLGIVGSFVGGWISTLLGYGRVDTFAAPSTLMAILGGIVVLFIHRKITKR